MFSEYLKDPVFLKKNVLMVMQTLREHLVLFANFENITFECFLKLLKKQGTFKKKKHRGTFN